MLVFGEHLLDRALGVVVGHVVPQIVRGPMRAGEYQGAGGAVGNTRALA